MKTANFPSEHEAVNSRERMQALVCHEYGPLSSLRIENCGRPEMLPGSVRVAVGVASVNPPDVLMPQGKYQVRAPVPFVPGVEGMGRVLEVAPGVSGFKPGDRVMMYTTWGCFAQEVVVPAYRVNPVPSGMS